MIAASSTVGANINNGISLEEQSKRAELIVIGKARRVIACAVDGSMRRCVELEEVSILRSNADHQRPQTPLVVLDSNVEELKIKCCKMGRTYLMFLNVDHALYFPFFGQSSIRQLADN
jgi:hypothetical protein